MPNDGIMQPAPASGASGGLPPATPSNFAARVNANSATPQQPPVQTPAFQPQARQNNWDQFQKPPQDGSQFQGDQQAHQHPEGQGQDGQPPQEGLEGQQPPQDGEGMLGMTPEQMQQLQAKIAESFKTGVMPEELLDVWTVKVPWGNGEQREVPIREVQQGFMRQSDYTRGKTQLREVETRLTNQQQGLNNIFAKFDNPEGMMSVMMQLGKRKTMEGMAKLVFKNWWEERQVVQGMEPERAKAYLQKMERARELEEQNAIEVRRREHAEHAARNNQGQQEQAQRAQEIQRQIDQTRPVAFKQFGIVDTPYHRQVFEQELVAVVNSMPGKWDGVVTTQLARDAARGAKEVIEDSQRRALAANQQNQSQAGNNNVVDPWGPNRVPSGPNSAQSQLARQNGQRRRPGSFGDDMRARNGGRPAF